MSVPGSSPVPEELPPQAALLHLTTGHWIMHGIYAVAQLEIADLLQEGPRTIDELARSAVAHPRSLHRLLRALASVGIFAEQEDGRFALTPMADCLRSHVPGSMRAWALLMGQPWDSAAWASLVDSVKTGRTAFDKVHGVGLFNYLAQHPDHERLFGQAMTSPSSNQIPSVLAAYDFSGISTLVDVAAGMASYWRRSSPHTRP